MKLTKTSIQRLNGVHPKLQAIVLLAAAQLEYPFNVSEGVRTQERQNQMYAEGKSKTKKGKHLIQSDGYGHAVDLYPLTDDRKQIDWACFPKFVEDMKSFAQQLGYDITCGADWKTFRDSPHFELKS